MNEKVSQQQDAISREVMIKSPPEPVIKLNGHRSLGSVYLICNRDDYNDANALQDYLVEERFEVLPPLHDGEEALVAQYHRESLLESDALLVYVNRASEAWAQMKRLELLKLPGLGRAKPVRAKAFYIGGETAPYKERFRSNEALVIKNYGGFSPQSLSPFLAQLKDAKGRV